MPTGWDRRKPEARRRSYQLVSESAAKSRSSAGMPIWSRSFPALVGMIGWIAMARSRMAMNSVPSTTFMRSGSVFLSDHGA